MSGEHQRSGRPTPHLSHWDSPPLTVLLSPLRTVSQINERPRRTQTQKPSLLSSSDFVARCTHFCWKALKFPSSRCCLNFLHRSSGGGNSRTAGQRRQCLLLAFICFTQARQRRADSSCSTILQLHEWCSLYLFLFFFTDSVKREDRYPITSATPPLRATKSPLRSSESRDRKGPRTC